MKELENQHLAKITAKQIKEQYEKKSEHDISDSKIYNSGSIGFHKYNSLIQKRNSFDLYNEKYPDADKMLLTEIEINQISEYENKNIWAKREKKEPIKIDFIDGIEVNKSNLYHGFLQSFRFLNGYDFVSNAETIKNLEVVLKYFLKDDEFFNCSNLLKTIDGVELAPSFKKGLLIVGNYGNGKSTIIKCFENLFNHNYKIAYEKHWRNIKQWNELRFKIVSCHQLVSDFECLPNALEKDVFNKKYSNFKYCFDDIKKEKIASNFGLTNVMQTILEKRYDQKNKTFLTMNFDDRFPNDISKALDEIGPKYGNHIYDRLFEMFNIIEFNGKSFRR